jgi:hypothetical protein
MTADDAHVLAELFASANYSVGEVTPVATGAYQGSGNPFTTAIDW